MLDELRIIANRLIILISNTNTTEEILPGILADLSSNLEASVMFLNKDGKVLINRQMQDLFCFHLKNVDNNEYIDNLLNEQFKNIVDIDTDVTLLSLYVKNIDKSLLENCRCMVLPAISARKRIGTLVIYRDKRTFSESEILIAQIALSFCTIILGNITDEQDSENNRKNLIVKSALDTLSYSELEAVLYIFEELGGSEGLIVASKVADRAGLTRSVIVNGLRKLESAGLIESRSLGMKGTYIKVNNDKLLAELSKLKN